MVAILIAFSLKVSKLKLYIYIIAQNCNFVKKKVVNLQFFFHDNKNMDIVTDFWIRVNALIKANNTKQQIIAEQCDLSYQTFRGWVTRKVFPDAFQSYKIAKALNTSVEYLITGKENETPKEVLDLAADINSLSPAFQNAVHIIVDQLKALSMR